MTATGHETVAALHAQADALAALDALPFDLTLVEHESCADYLRTIGVPAVSMESAAWLDQVPANGHVLFVDKAQRVAGDLEQSHHIIASGLWTPPPYHRPGEFLEARALVAGYDIDHRGQLELWRSIAERAAMIDMPPTNHPLLTRQRERAHSVRDVLAAWLKDGPLVHKSTGIAGLDDMTGGGIVFGTLTFVLGGPDAGKTLFVMHVGVAFARDGVLVGFKAVDEDEDGLVTRLAQRVGFQRRECEVRDPEVVGRIGDEIGDLPFLFFDADTTIDKDMSELAAEAKKRGMRAAYVCDSLQTVLCDAEDPDSSRYDGTTARVRALRRGAAKHRMVVVCTSEMSRANYRGTERDKSLSEMSAGKETGAIEYQGKLLLSLRAVDHENVELRVVKNKLGSGRRHLTDERGIGLAIDRQRQALREAGLPPTATKTAEETRRAKQADDLEQTSARAVAALRKLSAEKGMPVSRETVAVATGGRLAVARAAFDIAEARGAIRRSGGTADRPLYLPADAAITGGEDSPIPPPGTGRDVRPSPASGGRDGTGRDGSEDDGQPEAPRRRRRARLLPKPSGTSVRTAPDGSSRSRKVNP